MVNKMPTTQARNSVGAIIQEFTPIIRIIAAQLTAYTTTCLDIDDLVSVGTMGLMDAIDKYDPKRGMTFKNYAQMKIRGAMLEEIRHLAHMSRDAYRRNKRREKVRDALATRLGHAPTTGEMAAELKMTNDEFGRVATRDRNVMVTSVGGTHELSECETHGGTESPLDQLECKRRWASVLATIRALPTQERRVIRLYYDEDLTMKAIGKRLKVTESRVCQIHTKAIARLKAGLTDCHSVLQ